MANQPTFFRLARRSGLCLGGLFFVALGSFFAASGTTKLLSELRYRSAGIHVRGIVTSKSIERASGRNSSTSYQVVYRFVTGQGATVEGSDRVDVDQWEELKNGDPLEVVYLPDSPRSNRSMTTTEMPLALGFAGIGTFVFLVGGVVLAAGVRAASRNARLWREGVPAEATVLAKSVSGSEYCLRYRFHDLLGREFTHYDDTLNAEEYSRWEVGNIGMIRFDPQTPDRSVWVGFRGQAP
jgi:hypothetical protein